MKRSNMRMSLLFGVFKLSTPPWDVVDRPRSAHEAVVNSISVVVW